MVPRDAEAARLVRAAEPVERDAVVERRLVAPVPRDAAAVVRERVVAAVPRALLPRDAAVLRDAELRAPVVPALDFVLLPRVAVVRDAEVPRVEPVARVAAPERVAVRPPLVLRAVVLRLPADEVERPAAARPRVALAVVALLFAPRAALPREVLLVLPPRVAVDPDFVLRFAGILFLPA